MAGSNPHVSVSCEVASDTWYRTSYQHWQEVDGILVKIVHRDQGTVTRRVIIIIRITELNDELMSIVRGILQEITGQHELAGIPDANVIGLVFAIPLLRAIEKQLAIINMNEPCMRTDPKVVEKSASRPGLY